MAIPITAGVPVPVAVPVASVLPHRLPNMTTCKGRQPPSACREGSTSRHSIPLYNAMPTSTPQPVWPSHSPVRDTTVPSQRFANATPSANTSTDLTFNGISKISISAQRPMAPRSCCPCSLSFGSITVTPSEVSTTSMSVSTQPGGSAGSCSTAREPTAAEAVGQDWREPTFSTTQTPRSQSFTVTIAQNAIVSMPTPGVG